jgi:hypothetical protein
MFVIKDPRMTRVLPLWLEVLDERAITPIIIITFRNPLEVAASLERRNALSLANSLLVYLQGNLAVELASRGRRRLFQRYDDLISDWRSFVDKLANIGGPDATVLTPAMAGAIGSFLSPNLQRQHASRESLASLPAGAAVLAEMHDRMAHAAATGDETALRACFDHVRERIWETAKLFGAAASARAQEHRAEIARLEAKATGEARRAGAETEQLRAQVRALETRLRDAARTQATANKEIAGLVESTSWRVTAPLRAVGRLVRTARSRRPKLKHGEFRRT